MNSLTTKTQEELIFADEALVFRDETGRHVFDQRLVTEVKKILYDFNLKRGDVLMPPDCCVDSRGVCEMFEAIDPEVLLIQTWSGKLPDTRWEKIDGEWQVRRHEYMRRIGSSVPERFI